MKPIVCALLAFVSTLFRSRRSLLEIVALRHQLTEYQRAAQRPRINSGDRVSGPGLRVTGQGGGMHCFLFRPEP